MTRKDKQAIVGSIAAVTLILGFFGGSYVLAKLVPANSNPSQTEVVSTEPSAPAKPAGLNLAGCLIVYTKYCKREFYALAPIQQDAIAVYIQRDSIAVYGNAAVSDAASEAYEQGYYSLGQRWCSIGDSTARSIAGAMTRR